jgi:hypothetical protein
VRRTRLYRQGRGQPQYVVSALSPLLKAVCPEGQRRLLFKEKPFEALNQVETLTLRLPASSGRHRSMQLITGVHQFFTETGTISTAPLPLVG